ncbi:hypothetical protein D0Z07_1586 [Hyphodiscus hymeniophilus]|uniref:Uncharacterized protein n=1 Tax=Hyphodiscus hymeniophilus TaxID=353542 RepID=A0A9P6VPI1_9HELO|nr:hypothetical protein D0Z07_1586 [Hyphodiscus hymeniophilus]
MSFGWSAGDILAGLKICKWIWDNCYDKNNSADDRYNQFGNDVRGLQARLNELERALRKALEQNEHVDLYAVDLGRDTKELVGDFTRTLKQCEEILRKHVSLRRNRAGFIQSVIWATTAQDKVDALRRQIQFHTQKIYLILEPVKLGLATSTNNRLDRVTEMIQMIHDHIGITNNIQPTPEWLDLRFRDSIMEKPPVSFTEINLVPLKEGFDALYGHFRGSTQAFRDPASATQTAEQYLNLLKCLWLINTLTSSEEFQRVRSGSLYPWTIAQLGRDISEILQRRHTIAFDDKALQNLSPVAFLIWPPEQKAQMRFLTEPNVGEEVILKLSLPSPAENDKDNLVLFRTGPTALRIVQRKVDPSGTPMYENERFNTHVDKFIPYYAMHENPPEPIQLSGPDATSKVAICRGNETGVTAYEFPDDKSLFAFQRAITGYRVIWHWEPLSQDEFKRRESMSTVSDSSIMTPMSQESSESNTVVDHVLQDGDTSGVSIHESSRNNATIGLVPPPPPLILIYTQDDSGQYTYVHLEFGLQIVQNSCACKSNPTRCRRSVIRRLVGRSSETFQVRKFSTPLADLNSWNLSMFSYPRHPDFDSSRNMQVIKSKYLNLDFDTVEDRKEFGMKLNMALVLWDMAEDKFQKRLLRGQYLSDQPKKFVGGERSGRLRRKSENTITMRSLVGIKPPELSPIEAFEDISIAEEDKDDLGRRGSRHFDF